MLSVCMLNLPRECLRLLFGVAHVMRIFFFFQHYGVKCDLSAGEYQIVPYTTGCRFKQRTPNDHVREAKLVKKDKDDKIVITSAFRYIHSNQIDHTIKGYSNFQ